MLDKNKVEKFIEAAMKYKGDKYSQPKRMQPGYSDCSSLIYKALANIGLLVSPGVTVTTYRMGVSGDARFTEIPMKNLERGDLLWGGNFEHGKWSGHVAIYLGNNKTLEARYREGVDYNVKRPYFTKAFRVKTLETSSFQNTTSSSKNITTETSAKPVSYVLLKIRGKQAKISPFVVDGTSYVRVDNKDVPVRAFFEELGMVVTWNANRKEIDVN